MKYLRLFLPPLFFITIVFLGVQVIFNARENQRYKIALSELNHFTYGLLSVNAWKKHLSEIVVHGIDRFELSRQDEKEVRKQLEKSLNILIDKINEKMVEENLKTFRGKVKQTLLDSFVDMKEIKRGIPEYADAIFNEMKKPKTEAQIKAMVKSKLKDLLKETFDTRPSINKEEIVKKYGEPDEEATRKKLQGMIARKHELVVQNSLVIIAMVIMMFLIEGFQKGPLPPSQYITLTLTLLVLLAMGVTTPMIDMEARISELSFVLLNHPVEFKDQILYFRSKSILDVFQIMIMDKDFQMKLVGILMVTFSIVFPLLKMISSLAYYYDYRGARENRQIQFFVLKSGKWSMADVLAVAIFMAYIGFNGTINSQIENMASMDNPHILSTNRTSLQPGFYLFFAYCVLAMFLAELIRTRPYKRAVKVEIEEKTEKEMEVNLWNKRERKEEERKIQ